MKNEWLREVGFDTPALMVDVVVGSVVGEDPVDWVVWKCVTAMVHDSLDSGAGEEPHGLSHRHTREQVTQTGAQSVKSESLDWVVVQSAVGIWDVEAVVARVEGHYIRQSKSRGCQAV
jgi:hypothetical protein